MVPYQVPRIEKMTILDALVHIQRHHDRSLAFRYACRLGMCGTCTVMVNGVPRWACRTSIERLGVEIIRIAPLRFLPVVRMCWWTMNRSSPSIAPHNPILCRAKSAPMAPISHLTRAPGHRSEPRMCVWRLLCSCTMLAHDPEYLGPAALNRARWCATRVMGAPGATRRCGWRTWLLALPFTVQRCTGSAPST